MSVTKLVQFAKHVLAEQKSMGEHGDYEYIRMAEIALDEYEASKKGNKVRCCGRVDCEKTVDSKRSPQHNGKPVCKKCWDEIVNSF